MEQTTQTRTDGAVMRHSGGRTIMKMKKLNEAEKAMLLLNTLVNVLKDNGANIEEGFIDVLDDKGNVHLEDVSMLQLYNDAMKYLDSLKNSTNQENQTNDKPTYYV